MGRKRNSRFVDYKNNKGVQMKLDLSIPADARKYIDDFEIPGAPGKPSYIETNTGKRIEFDKMSDEEACVAAMLIYDLVQKAVSRAVKN